MKKGQETQMLRTANWAKQIGRATGRWVQGVWCTGGTTNNLTGRSEGSEEGCGWEELEGHPGSPESLERHTKWAS